MFFQYQILLLPDLSFCFFTNRFGWGRGRARGWGMSKRMANVFLLYGRCWKLHGRAWGNAKTRCLIYSAVRFERLWLERTPTAEGSALNICDIHVGLHMHLCQHCTSPTSKAHPHSKVFFISNDGDNAMTCTEGKIERAAPSDMLYIHETCSSDHLCTKTCINCVARENCSNNL